MKRSVALRVFRLKTLLLNESFHSIVAIGPLKTASTMSAMSLSMKTFPLFAPKMHRGLWPLSKILSSAFSDGFHVPLLKNDQNYDLYLSFCSHTPSALIRRSVSSLLTFYEIPGLRGFPCLNLPFPTLSSVFNSVLPDYPPATLPVPLLTAAYATRFLDFDVTLRCKAISSPSKSAPNPLQTRGHKCRTLFLSGASGTDKNDCMLSLWSDGCLFRITTRSLFASRNFSKGRKTGLKPFFPFSPFSHVQPCKRSKAASISIFSDLFNSVDSFRFPD